MDYASQMTTNKLNGGYVTYPPQAQLPASAQTIVINPPQRFGQATQTSFDENAQATNYRPQTDQYIGPEVYPALKNTRIIRQYSRYAPSMVTASSIPTYVSQNGVAASGVQDWTTPYDPTENGSR